jgi:nucleotide-binding universal stress UspA family protein
MYDNVLVAVDLEQEAAAEHLVRVARRLASDSGKVTLLHVVQALPSYVGLQAPGDVVDRYRTQADARLAELARAGADASLTAHGHPANTILDEAKRLGCDAIVVGSHRPGLGDYLLGSTAARIVRHAPCTVVVDRAVTA